MLLPYGGFNVMEKEQTTSVSGINKCACGGPKGYRATRCKQCHIAFNKGPNHNCWRGGTTKDAGGYKRVYAPGDPRANCGRYMKEHHLVMEAHLGRQLRKDETVHHKNGQRDDNRIENLELWSNRQPGGQRVEDKIKFALELLQTYAPDKLK